MVKVAEEKRWISLMVAFGTGVATCLALTAQYYANQGCAASRRMARRYSHQVSDQMCCPVSSYIGAVGLSMTAIAAILGVCPPTVTARALSKQIGRCCCCCRGVDAGTHAVVFLCLSATGLLVLGIFNLCWMKHVHGVGAFLFFFFGYALVGIECFSRTDKLSLFSLQTPKFLKPFMCILAVAAFPVTVVDSLTAEWMAIIAVCLGVLGVELDFRAAVSKRSPPLAEQNLIADDRLVVTW